MIIWWYDDMIWYDMIWCTQVRSGLQLKKSRPSFINHSSTFIGSLGVILFVGKSWW